MLVNVLCSFFTNRRRAAVCKGTDTHMTHSRRCCGRAISDCWRYTVETATISWRMLRRAFTYGFRTDGPTIVKWEYKIEKVTVGGGAILSPEQTLNDSGEEGWEAVAMLRNPEPRPHNDHDDSLILFKRPTSKQPIIPDPENVLCAFGPGIGCQAPNQPRRVICPDFVTKSKWLLGLLTFTPESLESEVPMQSALESDNRRRYDQPILRRLTFEQGKLFLVGYAYVGHQAARDIMEVLFPQPCNPRPWIGESRSGTRAQEDSPTT